MTLRMTYDLTPDSVVLDLGGYHGAWAVEIGAGVVEEGVQHVAGPLGRAGALGGDRRQRGRGEKNTHSTTNKHANHTDDSSRSRG